MGHIILNNNKHSMNTCLVVFHSIYTASTMSKSMAQNMKPIKTRMKRLLSVLCLWHEFFKIMSWSSSTQTILPSSLWYPLSPTAYFLSGILKYSAIWSHLWTQTSTFPPQKIVMSSVAEGLGSETDKMFWCCAMLNLYVSPAPLILKSNQAVLGSFQNLLVTNEWCQH